MIRALVLVLCMSDVAHAGGYLRLDGGLAVLYARNVGDSSDSFDSVTAAGFGVAVAGGLKIADGWWGFAELSLVRANGSVNEDGGPFSRSSITVLYPGAGIGVGYDIAPRMMALASASISVLWLEQSGGQPTAVDSDLSPTLVVGAVRSLGGAAGVHAKVHVGAMQSDGVFSFFALTTTVSLGFTAMFR